MILFLILLFMEPRRYFETRIPWPLLDNGDLTCPRMIKRVLRRVTQDAKVIRLMNLSTGLGTLVGGR